jgi:hypothetical protein
MTRHLAGSIAAFLPLFLGACGGTADDASISAAAGLAGSPCRCIHEFERDGELVGRLVPAGCIASADALPVCTVAQPAPGSPPHHTP